MLNQKIAEAISKAFQELYSHTLEVDAIQLQPTRKEFAGTHTFVMFPYLKITKANPEQSGKQVGEWLRENTDFVTGFNVVKGFLNLELSVGTWGETLQNLSAKDLGQLEDTGRKVMIEFSSPNTNKPLHLGHLRTNFLGDSVSRILGAAGNEVMKVNLVNDRGIHICKSMLAYQKHGNGETPESSGIKGDHLIGKYYVQFDKDYREEIKDLVAQGKSEDEAKKQAPLMLEAQEMLLKWEKGDKETVALWEKMNNWVYEGFDKTYHTIGIEFDKIYKESNTYILGKDIVEEGLKEGVFYKRENGSVWIDLSDEGMDEKLVLRGDGTSVYITQDMGTCDFKHQDFPFDETIFVVGNEQDYHFKVLFTIMKKLGRSYADGLHHLSYGMVDLPSGKMKSREGTVVDADDLLQEMFDTAQKHTEELGKTDNMSEEEAQTLYRTLGLGALKYFILKVDAKKRILFNPKESVEFQGNTGPFIQYTHARISAIIRRAKSLEIAPEFEISTLEELHAREIAVIQKLTQFEQAIKDAAKDFAPALIAQYAYDLAKEYNGFYQEISIFNEEDKNKVAFRISLSMVVAHAVKKSMKLLGIDVPERM